MKIGYINNTVMLGKRANTITSANTCHSFGKLGHEVTWLLPNRGNNKKATHNQFYTKFGFKQNFKTKILKTYDNDLILKLSPKLWFFLHSISFALSIKWHLLFNQYDLIYSRAPIVTFLCGGVFEAHTYSKLKRLLVFRAKKIYIINYLKTKYGKGKVFHLGYIRHPVTKIIKNEIIVTGNPKKKITGDVTIINGIKHKEIYNYLEGAEVLFLPFTDKYSCPLKLIEYLSTNKPIIYPNQKNVKEIVSLKPTTWDKRSENILKYLQDEHIIN